MMGEPQLPVWNFRARDESIAPKEIQTPDRLVRSLVPNSAPLYDAMQSVNP
jgi:hypothetical protein